MEKSITKQEDKSFLYLATRADHPKSLNEESARALIENIGKPLEIHAYLGCQTTFNSHDFGIGMKAMVVAFDQKNIDQAVDSIVVHAGGMPKQYSPLAVTKIKLYEHTRLSAARVKMLSYYSFKFTTEDPEFIDKIISRKDPVITSEVADENCVAHYGFQRWGGVIIKIYDDTKILLESPIDIFASQNHEKSLECILAGYTKR